MPRYKRYLDESKGAAISDVWADIPPLMGSSGERLGFPTQKPIRLLKRILRASSTEGDLVLDPFCGCGTTVAAARETNRRWVGVDISSFAIDVILDE
ncbi:MAG: site-specific DNA-methyltransferase [Acidimicrobiaceae bacterium]|nr:site-specific DNA-methyltransferase [Acidimicrobiaceae bacterium]